MFGTNERWRSPNENVLTLDRLKFRSYGGQSVLASFMKCAIYKFVSFVQFVVNNLRLHLFLPTYALWISYDMSVVQVYYGLKAQKPIAQGNALGKRATRCTPYRGKSKCNAMAV